MANPCTLNSIELVESESKLVTKKIYLNSPQGGNLHGVITRAKKQDEILNEIEVLDWTVEILRGLQQIHDT